MNTKEKLLEVLGEEGYHEFAVEGVCHFFDSMKCEKDDVTINHPLIETFSLRDTYTEKELLEGITRYKEGNYTKPTDNWGGMNDLLEKF